MRRLRLSSGSRTATVVVEEWGVTSAFFFRQYVDFSGELGVRFDGARFCQHLSTFDFFTFGSAQQYTDVVACLSLVEQFSEHFDAGAGGFCGFTDADDFDFFAYLDDASFYAAVTTVPRPEMENTSSTGIRKVPSIARSGVGM